MYFFLLQVDCILLHTLTYSLTVSHILQIAIHNICPVAFKICYIYCLKIFLYLYIYTQSITNPFLKNDRHASVGTFQKHSINHSTLIIIWKILVIISCWLFSQIINTPKFYPLFFFKLESIVIRDSYLYLKKIKNRITT